MRSAPRPYAFFDLILISRAPPINDDLINAIMIGRDMRLRGVLLFAYPL